VGLFRRKQETLNEQLLREAGLDPAQVLDDAASAPERPPEPQSIQTVLGAPPPSWGAFHGGGVGTGEWDTCVTATVPGLAGERVGFTTIPDGDVIVSEETGDADLSPLAEAVERRVDPPYRAVAARQDGDLWAVGAKRIAVAQLPFPAGDKLELSRNGSYTELRVDGKPDDDAVIPTELAELGDGVGASYFVEAVRIDGDLWEVRVTGF
jgi:hypothetical protein